MCESVSFLHCIQKLFNTPYNFFAWFLGKCGKEKNWGFICPLRYFRINQFGVFIFMLFGMWQRRFLFCVVTKVLLFCVLTWTGPSLQFWVWFFSRVFCCTNAWKKIELKIWCLGITHHGMVHLFWISWGEFSISRSCVYLNFLPVLGLLSSTHSKIAFVCPSI